MGGRLFSFSVDADLFKTLEIGTKVAATFAADHDRLIRERDQGVFDLKPDFRLILS